MAKLRDLIVRHWEIVSYLIFGGMTTLLSLVTYALFAGPLTLGPTVSNVLSWVCAVSFAFVTNKLWVFRSKSWAWSVWLREAGTFLAGRIFSGAVEMGGFPLLMWLGLDQALFGVEGFAAKLVITVVVIILNYFLSKFLVFRKKS